MSGLAKFLKIFILLTVPISAGSSVRAETLYVFQPCLMTTASFQTKLSEACPGIGIKVFSRFRDFEESVRADKPDAILTKPFVIEKIGEYDIRLKGSRKENTEESYVFVSAKTIHVNRLADKSIGILDFLGKKETDAFVGKYLNPIPELKRVPKIDDLLMLLTFDMADGILIPEIYVRHYKEKSKLELVASPIPNMRTGIVAVGVRQGKPATMTMKLMTTLDKPYLELLEIDKWK